MKNVRTTSLVAAMAIPVMLLLGSCAAKGATTSTASTVKLKSSATTVKAGATTAKVSATAPSATTVKAGATTSKAAATTASATTIKGSATTAKAGATTAKAGATTAVAAVGAKKGKVAASLPTVPAPVTTLKQGSGPLGTLKPVTTVRPTVTVPPVTVAAGSAPAKPEDRNCGDFENWADAKQFFDTYYPYYGDVAHIDVDGDGIPCESLSGSPK